jgi:uncharacterized membrane protein YdbT with pleckstrin-like domain
MSQIHYDAHPSMFRMRPFTTLLVILIMLAGLAIAVLGKQAFPAALGAQLQQVGGQAVQTVGIGLFALAALQLLGWWVSTRSDRLTVKDDELVWTHGLLNKQYTEINMSSVRSVRVRQSLFQRVMNAGDVTVSTAGDTPELMVRGLPNPRRISDLVKGQAPEKA